MTRNGHEMSRPSMEAYWLRLNDRIEREVTELPSPETLESKILELEKQIEALNVDRGNVCPDCERPLLACETGYCFGCGKQREFEAYE